MKEKKSPKQETALERQERLLQEKLRSILARLSRLEKIAKYSKKTNGSWKPSTAKRKR